MNISCVLRKAVKPWLARLDAIPDRDRYALLAAGLALVGAVEWMAVLPMRDKRDAIELAATTEAQGLADARATAESEHATQAADVTARLGKVDAELAALGVGGSRGESLSFLLSRTLQRQAVRVVSLRGLGAQELSLAVPGEAVGNAVTGVVTGAVADAVPATIEPQPKALYRHRYELTLGGDIDQLTAAVAALEHGVRPLRVERIRLASNGLDDAVQVSVTLVTIGMERSWLSL